MSRLFASLLCRASALRGTLALLLSCALVMESAIAQAPAPAPASSAAAATAPSYTSGEEEARDRLRHAHTLLLRNDGEDDGFPATPALAYPSFVSELTNWGRYRLVSDTQQADLVIELRSASTTSVYDGTADNPSATVIKNPYFRVTVADPQTLRPLWVYTVPVSFGKRKGQDLYKDSLENLVSNLKLLLNEPLSKQDTVALATAGGPGEHGKAALWVLLGLGVTMVGAGIATPILMKDAYNDEVAKQNQQQQQFCQQYRISPCP